MRMRLSQSHLNQLALCPRRFQYLFLDQFSAPITSEQQENLAWGNQFHRLMQQYELGLPVFSPAGAETQSDPIQQCVQCFIQATPDLFRSQPNHFRQSEHRRSLELQDYLLTVVYDLVILEEHQARILDWKTYAKPRSPQWLAADWQTRLYPFVLTETSSFQAEQISMTYWFVRATQPGKAAPAPASAHFRYNSTLHEKNRADLTALLTQLTQWLDDYGNGKNLPQVHEAAGHCATCSFARRCDRGQATADNHAWEISRIEAIQEIAP